MPSPFPGMDPFIESQKWADFHATFIVALRESLMPRLRPGYTVTVEERVYIEHDPEDPVMAIRPDVLVAKEPSQPYGGGVAAATVGLVTPVECLVPVPETVRETYLAIRHTGERRVLTVIEVLSPSNKRRGSDGYKQYQKKRDKILRSSAHFVEIDLLRGGGRLEVGGRVAPSDYLVLVSRDDDRPVANAYPCLLEQRLPIIPIPLAKPDPDVPVDLQELFTQVYDRAGYDYALDYREPLQPPLDAARAGWGAEVLEQRTPAGPG